MRLLGNKIIKKIKIDKKKFLIRFIKLLLKYLNLKNLEYFNLKNYF